MMIPRQKTLSRRTLLRGAGVALGLPWLEAMVPSALADSQAARRQIPRPHGRAVHGQRRQHLAVEPRGRRQGLPSFSHAPAAAGSEGSSAGRQQSLERGGEHRRRALRQRVEPCSPARPSRRRWASISTSTAPSMDQVAAQRVADRTPLPSLELGIEPESTGVDANVGYTRVYGCHIAWSNPTTPLARETNPRVGVRAPVPGGGPAGDSAKQDTLLLDRVLDHSKKMRSELGRRR